MYNKNFFPTPEVLIDKMFSKIKFNKIRYILEPSAGKGNIINALKEKTKNYNCLIDAIEIEKDLQHILKGNKINIVFNDFLQFQTMKIYDLIIMNPPFDAGDKHLLKAIELIKHGGQIACLLNAETIKNPYTNTRKELIIKLNNLNADISFIDNAFSNAERQTDVQTALIYIDKPRKFESTSIILDNLKKASSFTQENKKDNFIVSSDFYEAIIARYNHEISIGIQLINEYYNLLPFLQSSYNSDYKNPIIQLSIGEEKCYTQKNQQEQINSYIEKTRYKYWDALCQSPNFISLFTQNLREEYSKKIDQLVNYDFNLYNIKEIIMELSKNLSISLEKTILDLFDSFSHQYHYAEYSKNIHLFNGWKTNKSWKINKKVIIPLNSYDSLFKNYNLTGYYVFSQLLDIEKVFSYLDNGLTPIIDLKEQLEKAQKNSQTKNIDTTYFKLTFFKKGTCHIEFKNDDLLAKFNIFGSQKKGWLPPTYSKKQYKDMTKEEQEVIDNFEGKESYTKVMNNIEYFVVDNNKILQLEKLA